MSSAAMKCKDCAFWRRVIPLMGKEGEAYSAGGWCESKKIREQLPYEDDALVYPYLEGGFFWTGPNFGCVHFFEATK